MMNSICNAYLQALERLQVPAQIAAVADVPSWLRAHGFKNSRGQVPAWFANVIQEHLAYSDSCTAHLSAPLTFFHHFNDDGWSSHDPLPVAQLPPGLDVQFGRLVSTIPFNGDITSYAAHLHAAMQNLSGQLYNLDHSLIRRLGNGASQPTEFHKGNLHDLLGLTELPEHLDRDCTITAQFLHNNVPLKKLMGNHQMSRVRVCQIIRSTSQSVEFSK